MSSPAITTNAMARLQGERAERQRTIYAFEAHKAALHDRLKHTQSDLVRQAFVLAIIEITELQRTLENA